ncbi:MAG: hypothetical protein ACRDD8_14880 [Bacteroidales bacterium]
MRHNLNNNKSTISKCFKYCVDVIEDVCTNAHYLISNRTPIKKSEETSTRLFLNGTFKNVEVKIDTTKNEDGDFVVDINVSDKLNRTCKDYTISFIVDNAIVK